MFEEHIPDSRMEVVKNRKNKPKYSEEREIYENTKKHENQNNTSDSSPYYRLVL